MLFTIDPYYGNLNQIPEQEPRMISVRAPATATSRYEDDDVPTVPTFWLRLWAFEGVM